MPKPEAQTTEALREEYNTFLYRISHDLRAPLRHIREFVKIFIEELPADFELTDMQQKALTIIQESSDMTEEMMEALVVLSRLNTRRKEFEAVHLEIPFSTACVFHNDAIKRSGAQINAPKTWPSVQGDINQLHLLFQHIIGNCLKFQPEGQAPTLDISAKETPKQVVISVQDNGSGIDLEYAASAFEIFKKLDVANKHVGVGSGLAICKRIMDIHGGEIEFLETEQGTLVQLRFNN